MYLLDNVILCSEGNQLPSVLCGHDSELCQFDSVCAEAAAVDIRIELFLVEVRQTCCVRNSTDDVPTAEVDMSADLGQCFAAQGRKRALRGRDGRQSSCQDRICQVATRGCLQMGRGQLRQCMGCLRAAMTTLSSEEGELKQASDRLLVFLV